MYIDGCISALLATESQTDAVDTMTAIGRSAEALTFEDMTEM
jgi:hypothetical protein